MYKSREFIGRGSNDGQDQSQQLKLLLQEGRGNNAHITRMSLSEMQILKVGCKIPVITSNRSYLNKPKCKPYIHRTPEGF